MHLTYNKSKLYTLEAAVKSKHLRLITLLSFIACALHASMLYTPFNNYLYTSAFKVFIFILTPLIYCKISRQVTFKNLLSLFLFKKRDLKIPLLLGLGVFTFITAMFAILLPFFDREEITAALANNNITPQNAIFVFLYIVIINAALEQFFFRGFIFAQLHRMNFKHYAHLYSAVLFSFYHIPILFLAVSPGILVLCTVGLVAAGLIFNMLTIRFNSISAALVVHISANLALNMMIGINFIF